MVLNVEALLPLVYIYTIMVALQGFFIFLMFVVFSKSVRDAYKKWWNLTVRQSDWHHKWFKRDVRPSKDLNPPQTVRLIKYIAKIFKIKLNNKCIYFLLINFMYLTSGSKLKIILLLMLLLY